VPRQEVPVNSQANRVRGGGMLVFFRSGHLTHFFTCQLLI